MNDHALARTGDLFTAKAAAASVDVSAAEAVVLAALRSHPGGLTSHEIAEVTGRSLVSVSPRMRPLCEKGKVCADGRRDNRTIWRLAESAAATTCCLTGGRDEQTQNF